MSIQRATKGDKKYVKGNNSKSVDYEAKQEKRRELAERIKRPAGTAETAKAPAANPKGKKSS
jgi:hypothetical protein